MKALLRELVIIKDKIKKLELGDGSQLSYLKELTLQRELLETKIELLNTKSNNHGKEA